MAEEAANPDRDVPRAINMVLVTVIVVYIGMSLVALSAMPVKYNVLPVDPCHRTRPSVTPVVPGEPEGTVRACQSDPSQYAYLPRRADRGTAASSRRTKPTGEVYTAGRAVGARSSTARQLGGAFLADPVQGVVTFIPDELAWLRGILKVWVGILAATILFIATNAGLIGASRLAYSLGQHRQIPPVARTAPPAPHDALRLDHPLRDGRLHPDPAGQHTAARGPVRLRRHDLVHDRARLGRRAALSRSPTLPRPFRTPLNIPLQRRLSAAAFRHRRARHLHRLVRRRLRPTRRGASSASRGWRSACCSTSSTGGARASR